MTPDKFRQAESRSVLTVRMLSHLLPRLGPVGKPRKGLEKPATLTCDEDHPNT